MIPRQTIDQIFSAAKIEDVISDYMSLRRRGANLWGNCPFHDEKTPSFSVSPAKGIYKCFGCGKAGNAVNFVMEYEQCTYAEALKKIANKYHIEIKERELTEEEKLQEDERESLSKVNYWASQWFQKQLWETDEGRNIGLKYFIERGLREDVIRRFSLGYSPLKNALYDAATKVGYKDQYLEKTGLCPKSDHNNLHYDRFRDRVIFPIFSVSGKVIAFAGRLLKKKENTGKYVNSPESEVYTKGNELFGLYQTKKAISRQGLCYLVEGQMDLISMFQAGIENVVASGGTSLTINQIRLLHRFTENVTILYDGDAAGIHAALRGIDMLLEEGLNIKVVLLPDGEDPDSFSRKMNASDFIRFIEDNSQDFIRYKTNLLLGAAGKDPLKKSSVIKDIVNSIAVIPDVIKRGVYAKDCALLLDFQEKTLLQEINKIRREKYSGQPTPTVEIEEPTNDSDSDTTTNISQALDNTKVASKNKFEQNIINLLQMLVKYGDYPLFETTVGGYIAEELEAYGVNFETELFAKIFDEYKLHCKDDNFSAEAFFKFHQNPEIAVFAVNLMSEQYSLSKIYSKENISENVTADKGIPTDADRLDTLVPQLIHELLYTRVKEQQNYNNIALQHAQENKQEEQIMQLLQANMQLKEMERELCKRLGNRVLG